MSNKIDKTLFMYPPFSREYARLYQELLRGVLSYQQLGDCLIRLGDLAHTSRQYDKVREAGRMLSNFPVRRFQAIGHYFLGVAANSKGNGDQDEAKRLFEFAVDTAPDEYKVKSILSLGALSFHKGDFDTALYFFKETIKSGKLSTESIQAIRGISILKSIEGSHDHAIRDLEKTLPLIKYAPPHIYFDVLNSYAVELGEVGRIDEAENVSRLTVASSLAPYYPEWQATYSEISSTRKRPRYIQVKTKLDQEISNQEAALEIHEPDIEPDTNLLMFRGRKPLYTQVPHYSCVDAAGNQFTAQQKRTIIVDVVCNLDGADLERLFAFATEIDDQPLRSRRPRQIDLESKSTLEDLMCLWANNDLDPNDYVAVLSALRDCNNPLRFKNIINEMITYIYRFTQERMQGEAMWRKRVEAELTPESD